MIDAIKEADLALKEMTDTQKDALENAFGKKFAKDIEEGMASGSISTRDALQLIMTKTDELGLNLQQKGQLVADIFKGAGEDAGGLEEIMLQLNLSFDEQNNQLNENEEATLRLAEANRQNEAALADLFDASKSGFPAMLSNIKTLGTELYTGVLVTIRQIATSIDVLAAEAKLQGQSEAVKEMVENAKLLGTTVEEEAEIRIQAAEKNLKRLKQKVEGMGIFDGILKKKDYQEEVAKAEAFLEELNAIAKGESSELSKYLETLENPNLGGGGNNDPTEEELKRREAAAKKAQQIEQDRVNSLENIEKSYLEKQENRLANTAIKRIELNRARALEEAIALRASKEQLQQINDEFDAQREEKELENLVAFQNRKQSLLDELALAKAETDQEKEEIKEEARYEKELEKFQADLERLELNENQKNEFLQLLEEQHQNALNEINKRGLNKRIQDQEKAEALKQALINDSLNAAISLAGTETKIGEALLIAKQVFAAKETAIQLGLFSNKLALKTAEATGDVAAGTAKTAASAPFPANIPLIIGFAAQVFGIISAIKQAGQAKSKVKRSFAQGGYTDNAGLGYRDSTGHEVAGDVHVGEYVVPQVVRKDPEVPQILDYLERKRKKKLGLYADGGDTLPANSSPSLATPSNGNSNVESLMVKLMERLDAPLESKVYWGYEAEIERQKVQKKLNELDQLTKVKK